MQPFKNNKPSSQIPRRAFSSFSFTVRPVSSMTLLPARAGRALPHRPALLSLWPGWSPGEEPLVPCSNHVSLPSPAWFCHSSCSAPQQIMTFGECNPYALCQALAGHCHSQPSALPAPACPAQLQSTLAHAFRDTGKKQIASVKLPLSLFPSRFPSLCPSPDHRE